MATIGQPLPAPEPGWKRYDDADEAIMYTGAFTHQTGASTSTLWNGTQSYSTDPNAKITFKFIGSKLRLIVYTYNNRSNNIEIKIDDTIIETFAENVPHDQTFTLVYEKTDLVYGVHYVELRNLSTGLLSIDAIDIDDTGYLVAQVGQPLPAPEPGWRRFDDIVPQIKRIGVWNIEISQTYYYGGSVYLTYDANAELSFKFYGTSLRLIVNRWINKPDNIPVEIDGVPAGMFSCYTPNQTDGALQYRILAYEITGLEETEHTVVIKTPSGMPSNQNWNIDAIDIDDTGRLLHPDEVIDVTDLDIGKRIRCHYTAPSNAVGAFSGLGEETSDFIPSSSSATPNGDFYWICVDRDYLGRWKLIADRNVQSGISWDVLNGSGIASGSGLPKGVYYNYFTSPIMPISSATAFWSLPSSDRPFYVKFKAYIRGGYYILSSGSQTSSTGFHISYQNGSRTAGLTTSNRSYSLSGLKMNLNTWSEYMLVWTGSSLEWYVDGILDKQTSVASSGSWSNSAQGLGILRPNSITSSFGDADITYLEICEGTPENPIVTPEVVELNKIFKYGLNDFPLDTDVYLRLLTGGVSTSDKDNEWDKYIVNSDLNGTITPGDNNVWNWNGIWSQTSTTNPSVSGNRIVRGYSSVGGFSNISTSTTVNVNTGFRPVLLIEISHIKFEGSLDKTTIHNEDVILSGTITEVNNLDVQYRILVNGVQVYPETGFTALAQPPISINYTIPNSRFVLGYNRITVEMVNSRGAVGTWVTSVTLDSQEPAITASMTGNRLDVSIGDPESDLVRFRVLLNGTQVHPDDQTKEFTDLVPPTVTFSKLFRSNEVIIGSNNTVTIIAQDQYGRESTVTLYFIGEYAGLMFADETGSYYSDDLGNVLQYLDVGILVAGQISETYPVRLINKTGFTVTNIQLWKDRKNLPPSAEVQISKTETPFVPVDLLELDTPLQYNDEVTFYVRVVTQINGQPGQGDFDVFVKADPT